MELSFWITNAFGRFYFDYFKEGFSWRVEPNVKSNGENKKGLQT